MAAPFSKIPSIGISNRFAINLTITPHPNAMAGTFIFPNPCSAPLMVWAKEVKIIVKAEMASKVPPELALGNNNSKICLAYINIPNVHGSPINMVINKDKRNLLLIVSVSFFTLAPEMVGTSAVAKAILNASGIEVKISTLELRMPYFAFAVASPIIGFKILTTVTESIFLLIAEISELNEIGIETANIFLIIDLALSFVVGFARSIGFLYSSFRFILYNAKIYEWHQKMSIEQNGEENLLW